MSRLDRSRERAKWLGSRCSPIKNSEGRLVHAGRAGVGISEAELLRPWSRLRPICRSTFYARAAVARRACSARTLIRSEPVAAFWRLQSEAALGTAVARQVWIRMLAKNARRGPILAED
jgi:hypothetical protein